MQILYIDHSGNLEDADDHFVLGGCAVHELDVNRLRRRIENLITRRLDPHLRHLELHASAIRTGRGVWRGIPRPVKFGILSGTARALGSFTPSEGHAFSLFAVARSSGAVPGADPLERSFEELFLRFTTMLVRRAGQGDDQVGMAVVDEAKYEKILQPIARQWRDIGTRFGRLNRLVEVPLFVDSEATRLIQLADFIAHATYVYYQYGDDSLLRPMLPSFDTEGGVIHGLVHLTPNRQACPCPPCASRRAHRRR